MVQGTDPHVRLHGPYFLGVLRQTTYSLSCFFIHNLEVLAVPTLEGCCEAKIVKIGNLLKTVKQVTDEQCIMDLTT